MLCINYYTQSQYIILFNIVYPSSYVYSVNAMSATVPIEETTPRSPQKDEQVLPSLPTIRREPHAELVGLMKFKPIQFPVHTPQQQQQQQQQQLVEIKNEPFVKVMLEEPRTQSNIDPKLFDTYVFEPMQSI